MRGRADARLEKALTESYEDRSRGQTSMTEAAHPVVASMSFFAASPALVLRTARMIFEAPKRAKWRAASLPSPVFEPVTMTV